MSTSIKATFEGGREEYNIPFPYLQKDFVKVAVTTGDTEKTLRHGIDYAVSGSTLKMHISTIPSDTITIYRQTATDRLVVFSDGAILREADLTMLQLQLLHTIEEQGSFTITTATQDTKPLQIERVVNLAPGVTCSRGTLLGYKAGGFVIASNQDYTTLQDTVLALEESQDGKVKVLTIGQYGTNDYKEGSTCFVGVAGEIADTPPVTSGSFIKSIGVMEENILMFKPDSIAIQLA